MDMICDGNAKQKAPYIDWATRLDMEPSGQVLHDGVMILMITSNYNNYSNQD